MAEERQLEEILLDYVLYAPVGVVVTVLEELPKLSEKGRSKLSLAHVIGRMAVGQVQRRLGRHPARPAPGAPGRHAQPDDQSAATSARATSGPAPSPAPPTDPPARATSGPAPSPAPPTEPAARATNQTDQTSQSAPPTPRARRSSPIGAPGPDDVVARVVAGDRAGRQSRNGRAHEAAGRPHDPAERGHETAGRPEVASLAIPGYDTLAASQVVQRLGSLDPAELEAVRRYESGTRGRRTILHRIAQLSATDGHASS